MGGRNRAWAVVVAAGLAVGIVAIDAAGPPPKDVVVSSMILDYAADVAPRLNVQSDGLGTYFNSKNLTSVIQAIGDWVLDAKSPKAARRAAVDFVQPIPGSGPGGTNPTPPAAGAYAFRARTSCAGYGTTLLEMTAGQVKSCGIRFGFDIGTTTYAYVMNPLNAPNGPFPQTQPATITCIYPTTGSGACSQWKLTPSGTYTAPDGTVKYRNVAKLLEEPTGTPIDHGDFYVSFSVIIAK